MKEKLFQRLQELAPVQGASGFEEAVAQKIFSLLEGRDLELEIDSIGNLYALKKGKKQGPTLMVAAHMDQIGAVVKFVDDKGFLSFENLGGLIHAQLPGRMVLVDGRFGAIGCKAGHYQQASEGQSDDLYIDVGASSLEEVTEMGIGIGSPVTYLSSIHRYTNADYICGGALDNRLGCAILMEILLELGEFPGQLLATFTTQEETGFKGAMAAVSKKRPAYLLALDTIPAGGTPDMKAKQLITEIGRGPVFPVVSGHDDQVMMTNAPMRRLLMEAAKEEGIPYQLVIADRGNNDAVAPNLIGAGIPAASICIPRRYSHSPVETADLRDVVNTFFVLKSFVERMGELV